MTRRSKRELERAVDGLTDDVTPRRISIAEFLSAEDVTPQGGGEYDVDGERVTAPRHLQEVFAGR